ncbi:hypothetical protein V8C42DRAFT_339114 [Trichoderma barbatum]
MYRTLVWEKLIRRKPLLNENRNYCIGYRANRKFIRRESPLTERDDYFTDENTDDDIPRRHSGSPHRQILSLMASLFGVKASIDPETMLFPTAMNIRSILGEDRFDGVPERLMIVNDIGEERKLAAVKEGKWLMCAMILYQALDYLQNHKENGFTPTVEEHSYIFNPEDLTALIWSCLSEGKDAAKINTPMSDISLKNIMKQWITGQRLSSLIVKE